MRLNRVPHLVHLTGAHISKLIPGKYEHRYAFWPNLTFRRLLSWANLTRGLLLAQFAQAMGLCRYLQHASSILPPDLLTASAQVLSSILSHTWVTSCRDILALKGTPPTTPKAEPVEIALHEHDGAIYCRFCTMWLNGPTQWADHENGKKHRKAVRRTQVQLQLQLTHP